MSEAWIKFQGIARIASELSNKPSESDASHHQFDVRNIHPILPKKVKTLFDDGHFSQATFEALKFLDKEVARIANSSESGFKLMMAAFPESSPLIKLTPCSNETERNEQKGYQFLFAGSILAIRNPRGHEYSIHDSPDECLDYLAVTSVLLRRLQSAGYQLTKT
jgi:uncharacterized protein (TIGR02391 family)